MFIWVPMFVPDEKSSPLKDGSASRFSRDGVRPSWRTKKKNSVKVFHKKKSKKNCSFLRKKESCECMTILY